MESGIQGDCLVQCLAHELLSCKGRTDASHEIQVGHVFHHVCHRPSFHRGGDHFRRRVLRQEHDPRLRRVFADNVGHINSTKIGQSYVQHQKVWMMCVYGGDRFPASCGLPDDLNLSFGAESLYRKVAERFEVVDNHDADLLSVYQGIVVGLIVRLTAHGSNCDRSMNRCRCAIASLYLLLSKWGEAGCTGFRPLRVHTFQRAQDEDRDSSIRPARFGSVFGFLRRNSVGNHLILRELALTRQLIAVGWSRLWIVPSC